MSPDRIIFSGAQPSAGASMSPLLLSLAHDPEIGNGLISFVPQRQGEFPGVSSTLGLSSICSGQMFARRGCRAIFLYESNIGFHQAKMLCP